MPHPLFERVAMTASGSCIQPFASDAERERPLLNAHGRIDAYSDVDIKGRCDHLRDAAKALLAELTGFSEGDAWPDCPESDVLMSGTVGWHHDHGACFNPLRMLVAFPAVDGFVLDISRLPHDAIEDSEIDRLSDAAPEKAIRTSVPLSAGTVIFLDHDIWHRVRFTGSPSSLENAPVTLFYDFALNQEFFE